MGSAPAKHAEDLKMGVSGTKLVEKILNEEDMIIRTKNILIIKRRLLKEGDMAKKNSMICLGIESTAL